MLKFLKHLSCCCLLNTNFTKNEIQNKCCNDLKWLNSLNVGIIVRKLGLFERRQEKRTFFQNLPEVGYISQYKLKIK